MVIPSLLSDIPQPPKQIFSTGADIENLLSKPRLAVVGSRKVTPYGRQVTVDIVRDVASQGVVIISGLAYGVDALAHRAALEANGLTVAVLPGPLNDIAPRQNRKLAEEIVNHGGALITEYPENYPILKENFVARNRLVAGLADAVLITEAAEKSGSLHTARFAIEQGVDVMAVPGNINSPMSKGANNLIKRGATPVTDSSDVLFALGLEQVKRRALTSHDPLQQKIIEILNSGLTDADDILQKSRLEIGLFNQTLTMMEITGIIRPLGANHWALA